tara:strand:+ start:1156 stop:2406 length:1251 start_codon:yes stop_codon:yes gene_type:complete
MRLLDCNDASLRLWNEDEALWSPGIAWFTEGQYRFGEPAWLQARRAPREINNRFWHRLSTQPLSPALGPARHTADLVHAHLEALLGDGNDDLTLAIPGAMESGQLSLLLGILQTLPVTASSVVHRSALVGAATGQSCAHVELQLHQASITLVTVENQVAQAGDTQVLPGHGLLGLMDEIAERIGEQFVTQTRFDPQRRAETEQTLYQQIPDLLRSLAIQSEISCTVEGHTARITADALRPVGDAFTRALAPLLPAAPQHIALDSLLSALPGLALPHDHTETGPEVVPAIAQTMALPEGALHFQREAPCGIVVEGSNIGSAKPDVASESPSNTEVKADQEQTPLPATHQLVAGCATPLSPGTHIADGAVISGPAELSIESGASVQLNGQPAEGVISLSAGDQLTAAGVEVLFIAVEP